jgi:hypothetical protein
VRRDPRPSRELINWPVTSSSGPPARPIPAEPGLVVRGSRDKALEFRGAAAIDVLIGRFPSRCSRVSAVSARRSAASSAGASAWPTVNPGTGPSRVTGGGASDVEAGSDFSATNRAIGFRT